MASSEHQESTEQICPKCGATMLLRTARRGRNAGNKFYGCPNWRTTCKDVIVNIENSKDQEVNENGSVTVQGLLTKPPVQLNARERFENHRTLFFQNIAIPKELLNLINKGEISRDKVGFFGQWRIDFPETQTNRISEKTRLILLVAKKILTRGKITILSPDLETILHKLTSPSELDASEIDLKRYLGLINPSQNTSAWLDGKPCSRFNNKKPEQYLYEDIFSEYIGPYYKKFVLPQVHFSSMVSGDDTEDSTSYQRVDFLVTTLDKSFVVEVDDAGHEVHQSRDDNRTELLHKNGFQTIRISNQELSEGSGPNLQELIDTLEGNEIEKIENLSPNDKYLLAVKLAYQFQLSVIEAINSGLLPLDQKSSLISFDADSVFFNKTETNKIIKAALADLQELLDKLCALYEVKNDFKNISVNVLSGNEDIENFLITFNENQITKKTCLVIQDITFPNAIAHNPESTKGIQIAEPKEPIMEYFLNYIFRFESFLEGQFEAISRVLQGKDAVVLLPTGAGKSIAFQLASFVMPGVTIVVDPIIALIDDQKENLFRNGIDRVEGITSQSEGPIRSQLIQSFSKGEYIFCYIAPERLQSDEFRNNLKALTVNVPISLIAIDEAHCVSEWGHDFRTAYLNVGRTTREYCKSNGRVPPLLALTGTASSGVLRDVQRELQISDFEAIITPKTFDRKELHFSVHECKSDQKSNILSSVFEKYLPNIMNSSFNNFYRPQNENTKCGIVFCPHAGGPFGVVKNSDLISALGIESRFYSGKKPKGYYDDKYWTQLKRQNASDFKNNKYPVLIATKSFGMGIDKPNIRYTVHLGLPGSIESFYQEAGRAGRDRNDAHSILILSNDFKERAQNLLNPDATIQELNRIMDEERDRNTDDDVTRALWFHLNSFRGVDEEIVDIKHILDQIGSIETTNKVNIVFQRGDRKNPNGDRNNLEKAVHRLLLLGVVSDYTIDYASNEFRIILPGITKDKVIEQYCRYVEGYNRGRVAQERAKLLAFNTLPFVDFVLQAATVLIDFIYDTIEKGRRRAFSEILSMTEEAVSSDRDDQDTLIRERILRYFETSYSEEIQQILEDEGDFKNLKIIFDGGVKAESGEMIGGVRSSIDSAEIRGQVARYLESTPDHPGLLFLRSLSEIYCEKPNFELAFQNIEAARNFAIQRYRVPKNTLYDILAWVLEKIYNRDKKVYSDYIDMLIEKIDDREFTKALLNYAGADENMLLITSVCIFNKISKKALKIINS